MQTFSSYIIQVEYKVTLGDCPNLFHLKNVGRIGTEHGEEWDMYDKIKIGNYLK